MTDIQACTTTLYGFSGEGVACIGKVSLLVTFGEYPLSVTKMTKFMVVNTPSAYNAILGRPILIGLGEIASVRHLAIKFPTSKGTGIIRGDQLAARECYGLSTRGKGNAATQTLVLVTDAEKANAKAGTEKVENFDPKVGLKMVEIQPVEDLDIIYLEPNNQSKTVRIGKGLTEEFR